MTILVTGALGFIGSNLVGKLLKQGHLVIGVDNMINMSIAPTVRIKKAAPKKGGRFLMYRKDILNEVDMRTITVRHKPDVIVHLAALGSVPRSFDKPVWTVENNDVGFVRMIELASSLSVKKFIFASSSSVYGDDPNSLRKEGREGKCLSPYALTKKFNEEFARVWSARTGLSYTGLRFFNVYGPGQISHTSYSAVIPRFISEATPTVNGDGNIVRDFTFVDDVCEAIICAFKHKGSDVFNVGTGRPTSINDLLEHLEKKQTARYLHARPGDIDQSIADISHAAEVLGFQAKVSIEDGLKKTVKFFKEQGDAS